MLEMFDGMIVYGAIAVSIAAISTALAISNRSRLALVAATGGWVGLATMLAATGRLVYSPDQPAPYVGILFAAPLVTTTLAATLSRKVRETLLGLPLGLLVGLNAMRFFGVMFLLLAALGRLSGPFPYSAGIGDAITSIGAMIFAPILIRGGDLSARTIGRWNLFGALDLFAAVGLGLVSANGSPVQLLHVGVGSEAMQHLPYALVPTVLVPFYLITHGIIAGKLARSRRAAATGTRSMLVAVA